MRAGANGGPAAGDDPGAAPRIPTGWMYHSVSDSQEPDPYLLRVTPGRLESQLKTLRRLGVRGVSLHEALSTRDRPRQVALTFDDGYADFVEHAMPLLARYRMTASVYVVAERIGSTNTWDTDAPQVPLMTADHVRTAAAAGHEVSSHSCNHVRLPGLDPAALAHEVGTSRALLEDVLQQPVHGFCYPYGDSDDAAAAAVRTAGYEYGCVTNDCSASDDVRLPRYYVGEKDGALRLAAKELRLRLAVHRTRRA